MQMKWPNRPHRHLLVFPFKNPHVQDALSYTECWTFEAACGVLLTEMRSAPRVLQPRCQLYRDCGGQSACPGRSFAQKVISTDTRRWHTFGQLLHWW
jgi:hypothetical protein